MIVLAKFEINLKMQKQKIWYRVATLNVQSC